jgi:hypothetical protein
MDSKGVASSAACPMADFDISGVEPFGSEGFILLFFHQITNGSDKNFCLTEL